MTKKKYKFLRKPREIIQKNKIDKIKNRGLKDKRQNLLNRNKYIVKEKNLLNIEKQVYSKRIKENL